MDHKEAQAMLRQVGFNAHETHRLMKLRQKYVRADPWPSPAAQRRLEFARWLVAMGRLTDQLV
ncbi:MAG: hypothetical protein J2P37_33460 [Ktedonobacteraceae bacterium]|nr:hypothetical protein [Ktedonobacteraceae bacterium]MBO0792252.1 hypothetical protein [Ktedonobacteraceae bacterium]